MTNSHSRRFPWPAIAAAGLISLVSPSCSGSHSPVTSTLPTTRPTPSPTPGTGGVAGTSCRLGYGSADAACSKTSGSHLLPYVESAIDLLVREKPQLLDLASQSAPNTDQFRVLDREAYLDTIVENLRRQGLCSERDPDDVGLQRILVKDSNDFSEAFSVLSDRGFIRRGDSAYLQTCDPASFPVERTSDMPPVGSGCGRPYPPAISRFNVKVHLHAPEYYTIDSTPIVGPNAEYCYSVGFTDGRILCPIRPEGWADRVACEGWRVGKAKDTGRPGPTWTNDTGALCTGPESNCSNHQDNQYHVLVYRSGTVTACAESGACGSVFVER